MGHSQAHNGRPTSGRALRARIAMLTQLGMDSAILWKVAGLQEALLLDTDRVSSKATQSILVHAWNTVGPDVLLRFGAGSSLEALGVLGLALQCCQDLQGAVELWLRNINYWDTSLAMQVIPADESVFMRFVPHSEDAVGVSRTLFVVTAARYMRLIADRNVPFQSVCVPIAAPKTSAAWDNYFGVAVTFDSVHAQIEINNEDMVTPLAMGHLGLRSHFEELVVAAVAAEHGADLKHQVRNLIRNGVSRGATDVNLVAKTLGLSPRTLQRRLREDGVSYRALKEDTIRALARDYLSNSSLALSEVAFLLGFDAQPSFYRACKRWFSMTPSAVRAEMAVPPSSES